MCNFMTRQKDRLRVILLFSLLTVVLWHNTQPAAASSTTLMPHHAISCAAPVRIMPLGDSITHGGSSGVTDPTQQVGYRRTLWNGLVAAGYNVDFVGTLQNGQAYQGSEGFDPHHEGHAGWAADRIANRIYQWLALNPADIILLHIGTNKLKADPTEVGRILDEIDRFDEDIIVVIAQITNWTPYNATVTQFNNNVEAMALARIANGDQLMLVDMEDGAGITYAPQPAGDMWDDRHPYATGYIKMAAVWQTALNNLLPACTAAPTIISPPLTAAVVGQSYQYDVQATGFPQPTYNLSSAPAGMTINAATGLISWTPSSTGSVAVTVEASNNLGSDSQSFTISVAAAATAPVITSAPVTTGLVGQPYSYAVTASGTPAPTFALTAAPAGMTIDATSGLISWTPGSTGSFNVTVTAGNSAGSDSQSFTVTVTAATTAPSITSTPVTGGVVGASYSYAVTADGTPAPTFALTAAPAGMTINGTSGLISWTPGSTGSFAVTVTASNSVGSDSQSFTVTVVEPLACAASQTTYWQLEEPSGSTLFTDAIGGHHGSCTGNGCPAAASGRVGGAQLFDGGDSVNVPHAADLTWNNNESFSLELWVNTTQSCAGNVVFLGKYKSSGNNASWWLGCGGSGNAVFSLRDSGGTAGDIASSTLINDGQWHHLVAVRDGAAGENRLYVDGMLANTVAVNYPTAFASSSALNIGHYINKYRLQGRLDEMAIHRTALAAAEVQEHYTLGSAGIPYCTPAAATAPTITSAALTTGVVGQLYSYAVTANGTPAPTFALTAAPAGMTINATTGMVTWTPAGVGTFDVTVTASNSAGSDSQSFTIAVSAAATAPVITSAPVTAGVVGQSYSYAVAASGTPAPTFALTAAPAGMTINATSGLISWTPGSTGSFDVTVTASNSAGSDSQSFTVTVTAANTAPSITSTPVTGGVVGASYSYAVTADGTPAPTFALTAAPAGMTINGTSGLISWTPETAGSFDVTVTASNSAGSDSQSFTVTVTAATTAPSVTSTPVTNGVVGESYSYMVTAGGTPMPTFALTVAPVGMTIDAVTGVITWTPEGAGVFAVTVTASNSAGSDSQSFTLTVVELLACAASQTTYWQLEEPSGSTLFTDAIGGHHGSCTGTGCPAATSGRVGGAQLFDGGDSINVPHAADLTWNNYESFSLELWVNTTQSCAGNVVFLGKYKSNGNNASWWLGCGGSGNAVFSLRDSGGTAGDIASSTLINDGQWHHLVAVRDGAAGENRLYVDGTLANTVAVNYPTAFASSSALNLGHYINKYRLQGQLDEVAIHSTALAAAEVQEHYTLGTTGLPYCTPAGTVQAATALSDQGSAEEVLERQLFLPLITNQD